MSLNDLKKVIPHSWRIQSVKGEYAQLVAYIDSRDVQNILDEVLGQANWADDYKEVDGKVFAGIGILVNEITGWVWKWDCGTESNIEKEKGQASDAFKRACFNLGIGRELYDYPIIQVKLLDNEFKLLNDKPVPTWDFKLKEWNWFSIFEDGKLVYLGAKDQNGTVRYNYDKRQKK